MRSTGKACSSTAKDKDARIKAQVGKYLRLASGLGEKPGESRERLYASAFFDDKLFLVLEGLSYYQEMITKHMGLIDRRLIKSEKIPPSEKIYPIFEDLVERRLLKEETISHKEKLFSVFQPCTEWVTKGKLHPNVEIGKKLFVTTDQFNLIVDYQIGEHQADNQLTLEISDRLLAKCPVQSLSVDKGFSEMADKALLEAYIPEVVMPKKGRRNQEEKTLEQSPAFKKRKNKHSAIESNINELEHRGLNRCPDRNQYNFNRYVGMGVTAYNLHKIGRKILQDRLAKEKKGAIRTKASALAA